MSTEHFKSIGDFVATGVAVGTLAVVINWLTIISLLLTIAWWLARWYEKVSGNCFEDLPWIKRLFRRK